MLRSTVVWERFARRIRVLQTKPFCSKTSSDRDKVEYYNETYKQLEKLDFATASKILFTDPPKKKKFGFDFHMVQLFFACLPSLAVYLVAQYARYEMRRMEGELELKKRQKEEEKAKELEVIAAEEKDPELMEFKERLNKLEETIKDIVVESKKQSVEYTTKKQKDDQDPKILGSKNSKRASESTKYNNNSNRPDEPKESVMALGADEGRSSEKTTVESSLRR